jgi:hypothetical protein
MPIGALSPSPAEIRFEVCGILGNDRSAHPQCAEARPAFVLVKVILAMPPSALQMRGKRAGRIWATRPCST